MSVELLAPAGSFEAFKQAIYNGCDAVYLATERFGARAYAKNLTLEELDKAIALAHPLGKKIYVTVNTILKENELEDCKEYVKTLYQMGVDGLILADYSMITYVIENLPGMEAHISTQAGIKCLADVRFFEEINAKRCVLARENSIDEIKQIKKVSNMPLEVFAYGALCVSYSGGCLLSSILTGRSGNRGRCAQNCRRSYKIYKDGKLLANEGFHLSMRDLNTTPSLHELIDAGADSLKLEGRMKSPEYVKIVVSEFRKKIDNALYTPKALDTVFHRNYTEGFLFGEDKGKIVDLNKRTNEGAFSGTISDKVGKLTKVNLSRPLKVNDRIRIEGASDEDYYFTIDHMYDLKNKEIESADKVCLLDIFKDQKKGQKIYKMVDSSINLEITNDFKKPIIIEAYGSVDEPLTLTTTIDGQTFTGISDGLLQQASSHPIDDASLKKQLNKLQETSYYLEHIENHLIGDLFMPVSQMNQARRNLLDALDSFYHNKRVLPDLKNSEITKCPEADGITLTAFCKTEDQYKALVEEGIDEIYYKNYSPYVGAKHEPMDDQTILVGNYGGLYTYKGKKLVADYSFNAFNSEAIQKLHQAGANIVTLSLEMDMPLIKETIESYKRKYNSNPGVEMIVYGHQNLMTLKYCPLRRFGECGQCEKHSYYLEDEKSKFLLTHKNCISNILNEKALNLIDDLKEITSYVERLRLQFTVESYEETKQIVKEFKEKISNINTKTNYFDSKSNTRGYYKRPVM